MTYETQTPLNVQAPCFKHDRTTIIIPCYNEANRLHLEVFLNFACRHPNISFIFVDDGSKDLTISLLCGAMAALPKHCLLYTSPSPRDRQKSRMPSSA